MDPEKVTPADVVSNISYSLNVYNLKGSTLKERKVNLLEAVGLEHTGIKREKHLIWEKDEFSEVKDQLQEELVSNKVVIVRLTLPGMENDAGNLFVSQLVSEKDLEVDDKGYVVFTDFDGKKADLNNVVKAEAFVRPHSQKVKLAGRGELNLGGGFRVTHMGFSEEGNMLVQFDATLNDISQRRIFDEGVPIVTEIFEVDVDNNGLVFPSEDDPDLSGELNEKDVIRMIFRNVVGEEQYRKGVSRLFAAMAEVNPQPASNSIEGVYSTQNGKISGSITDFDSYDMSLTITDRRGVAVPDQQLQVFEWQKNFYERFRGSPLYKLNASPKAIRGYKFHEGD